MNSNGLTVALDGPAAAGKSTVGRRVADEVGALFFDTGVLYRALTDQALRAGVDPANGGALAELVAGWRLEIAPEAGSQLGYRLLLNGEDVTSRLRTSVVDRAVSKVSAHREVRSALLERQREVARSGSVVMVGRDIGTVVAPDADVKIFLAASAEERARRRFREILRTGRPARFADILAEVQSRDEADASRAEAPLRAAGDAVVIDSSDMTFDQVVAEVKHVIAGATRDPSS
jgi:cytidylate kinase